MSAGMSVAVSFALSVIGGTLNIVMARWGARHG